MAIKFDDLPENLQQDFIKKLPKNEQTKLTKKAEAEQLKAELLKAKIETEKAKAEQLKKQANPKDKSEFFLNFGVALACLSAIIYAIFFIIFITKF